jgi:hypothetical protein
MKINNLLIPPDDPRGYSFTITRNPGQAYTPTAIENRLYVPEESIGTMASHLEERQSPPTTIWPVHGKA